MLVTSVKEFVGFVLEFVHKERELFVIIRDLYKVRDVLRQANCLRVIDGIIWHLEAFLAT